MASGIQNGRLSVANYYYSYVYTEVGLLTIVEMATLKNVGGKFKNNKLQLQRSKKNIEIKVWVLFI